VYCQLPHFECHNISCSYAEKLSCPYMYSCIESVESNELYDQGGKGGTSREAKMSESNIKHNLIALPCGPKKENQTLCMSITYHSINISIRNDVC